MSPPSIVVRGATSAITRRTTLRKAFLGPWHPSVRSCWLYSLADAQRATGVAVHHSTLVLNHHHTEVTPSADNLPEFKRRFHRDLSCSLHALLCAERYDAPRELFDDRPTHTMRLVDAAAQASHLVYGHLNTVAAGLVRRPEHMPQQAFDFGLWKSGYLEVERPEFYFSRNRPERLLLRVTPPPELYRAFGGDMDALVHHMQRLSEAGLRAIHSARTRAPMGARALRRMHPWSEPRTLREAGGRPVRTFRIGARGIVGRTRRIEAACEVRWFRSDHRCARQARRDGDLEARFPYGAYAARVHDGAPTELAALEGAIVTAPGVTLEEVRAELAGERRDTPHALVDEVRDALVEEAGSIVEELDHEWLRSASAVSTPAARVTSERSASEPVSEAGASSPSRDGARLQHRFDKHSPDPRIAPVRVVTLRDKRRGRPPSRGPRRGGDPPA